METAFQTSFIPKQPVTESQLKRSSASVNILLFLSIIIFVLTLVGAGLLYFYKTTLQKGVDESAQQLEQAKDAFEGDFITDLKTADRRLRAANTVLENHVQLSPVFDILQSSTLKTVRFTKFTHSVSGTGSSATVEVRMSGKARDYESIALQSDALTRSKYIRDPLFSNLTVDEQGNIIFDVTFSVDPNLVLFTNTVARGGSVTGENTQAPSTNTLPVSNQTGGPASATQ